MTYKPLRLLAEDQDDLHIISASCQDAIFKVADAVWLPSKRRFSVIVQRYMWENAEDAGKGERVWAVLAFNGVLSVRAHKVAQTRRDGFASLLAIGFEAGEPPEGTITLTLADGGAIALEVECVDVLLTDLSKPREAVGRPHHEG